MRLTGALAPVLRGAAAVLAALLLAGHAAAHFESPYNLRVVHLEHSDKGMTAYYRLNLPLVVANGLGPRRSDGSFVPAPYTTNRVESGQVFHYLDTAAVRGDVMGLARLLVAGHSVTVDGRRIEPVVQSARVHPKGQVPPFNTLAQVKAATAGATYPAGPETIEIGYVLVDVRAFYPKAGGIERFDFSSTLRPGGLSRPRIVNMLVDHRGGKPVIYRFDGLLANAVTINPSALSAAGTFIVQGVRHIFGGKDHLLFVLCLTVAARTFGGLAWRVTGFTLGHTVTLIAGFLGVVPAFAWFIPAVEAAIALSIIYAGVVVFWPRQATWSIIVTTLIGVLHGLGFSFALRDILNIDGPNLLTSLVSFNIGVELGQLAIILAVWPALVLLARWQSDATSLARRGVAAASIVVAAVWVVQRSELVWQAI